MDKPARVWSFRIFRAWEFFAFIISGVFALVVANGMPILTVTAAAQLLQTVGPVLAFGGILWVMWLGKSELYASRRISERKSEVFQIVIGVMCAAGGLSLVGVFANGPMNDADFLLLFILSLVLVTVLGRVVARGLLRVARAHDRNLRHVAIVGSGLAVRDLAMRLSNSADSGIVIAGVFGAPADMARLPNSVPVGGNLDDLSERMMREPIDEVIVTHSFSEHYQDVVGLIDRCRRVGVPVRMVDESLAPFGMRPKIEYVGGVVSLVYEDKPNWGWRGQVKDIVDTLVSGLAVVALLPVFIVVAIAIKLDSPGPVFFVQPRVGKNRVTFPFYKFRTMRQDAAQIQASLEQQNESAGPTFKIANDPRVTRVGRFLRKYSIDELPQFLNVLKGEMSLVGPRPLPLRDVERFETDWHSRRFSVKPGLTCSWVVAGRSELSFDRWVEMDLAYIDNWSLRKDASIILNTIPAVLRGSGAY